MTKRRPAAEPPPLPSQRMGALPVGRWFARDTPVAATGVVWLIRPMPDGQWPPEQNAPRDDSFSWWVRSSCGHPGGLKHWAFYHRRDAEAYEQVFREDPCRWTRCKIKNEESGSRP